MEVLPHLGQSRGSAGALMHACALLLEIPSLSRTVLEKTAGGLALFSSKVNWPIPCFVSLQEPRERN